MAKMKITKRQLINLVENMESRTIHSVQTDYDLKTDTAKKALLHTKGYDERIARLQTLVNEVQTKAVELNEDLRNDVEIRYEKTYNTLPSTIRNFVGAEAILVEILEEAYFDGGLIEKIENERTVLIESIHAEYANVKANIESFSSIKAAAEYLESIGFDLSKFKIPETALIANIDTSKLFYKEVE